MFIFEGHSAYYQCIRLYEVDVVMSSEGHIIEMGNRWGREKGMGREREGGGQFTSNMGPEWTRVAPHAKEGFQVSKRDSGTGGGILQAKGELSRWIIEGYQGDCVTCSNIMLTLYISCYCACVVLIKELCLGYK
jgi:hypothetical protein